MSGTYPSADSIMNISKSLPKHSDLFFVGAGAVIFGLSLFNRKTRALLIKFLGFGAGLVADYVMHKYFPKTTLQVAKVIPNVLPLMGYKGGKATKRRSFKHLRLDVK